MASPTQGRICSAPARSSTHACESRDLIQDEEKAGQRWDEGNWEHKGYKRQRWDEGKWEHQEYKRQRWDEDQQEHQEYKRQRWDKG